MNSPDVLRVGLIGANRRGLWYGAIFDDIDPAAYAELDPPAYHHMTYYSSVELLCPRAKGFRLARVYDRDPRAARRLADAFRTRPRVCAGLEEASDDVDVVFIANESGDGTEHPALAEPGIRKGRATFIDRPLGADVARAKAILALAAAHGAPVLSCSHLRMTPQADRFKARYAEIGPLEFGTVQGFGPDPAHVADGIELAVYLFADEFGGRVRSVRGSGNWPLEILHLACAGEQAGRMLEAVVVNAQGDPMRDGFSATAMSLMTPIYLDCLGGFAQPEGGVAVMDAIREMVRSGQSPLSASEMIEPIAVADAGRKAHCAPEAAVVQDAG